MPIEVVAFLTGVAVGIIVAFLCGGAVIFGVFDSDKEGEVIE